MKDEKLYKRSQIKKIAHLSINTMSNYQTTFSEVCFKVKVIMQMVLSFKTPRSKEQ